MRSYSLIAPAKINLYLKYGCSDGYHELAMVLQSINLADQIQIRASSTDTIRVRCDHPSVPTDKSNLAYQAAELMATQFSNAFAQYGGVEITIHKRIPVAAGLAGVYRCSGSFGGLDLLWKLGTQSELQILAAQLGSDVPFVWRVGQRSLPVGASNSPHSLDHFMWCWEYRSLMVSTAWAQTYRQQEVVLTKLIGLV